MIRSVFILLMGAVLLVLSGCGIVHVHNEEKAKLSKEAKEEFAKVNAAGVIETDRKNYAKLAAELTSASNRKESVLSEMQLADAFVNDRNLWEATFGGGETRSHLMALLGLGAGTVDARAQTAIDTVKGNLRTLRTTRAQVLKTAAEIKKTYKWAPPACYRDDVLSAAGVPEAGRKAIVAKGVPGAIAKFLVKDGNCSSTECMTELAKLKPDQRAAADAGIQKYGPDLVALDGALSGYRTDCGSYHNALYVVAEYASAPGSADLARCATTLDKPQPGLKHMTRQVVCIYDSLKGKQIAAEAKLADLAREKAELEKLQKAAATGTAKQVKAYREKLATVQKALAALAKAGGVFGKQMAAEDSVKNIDAAITAIATGKLDDETKKGKTAFAIVATFGSILDKLPKLVDQRNRPKVSHLILQRNIAKARLDYANKIIALEQKRIDDRMAYLHAVEKEFTEWEVTRKSLCAVIGSAPCTLTDAKTALASDGVRTIFSDKTASQLKNDAFSALSVWGAARRGHRGAQKGLFWSMHLEKKERSLALSERALAIRSTLISSSLDQIATYHALGVKQEDLVRLVTGIVQLGTTIGILGTVQ